MDKARKNLKVYFLVFILYVFFIIGIIVGIFYLQINDNYKVSIAMVMMIILIVGVLIMKPRFIYHVENLKFYRLKESQSPMIESLYSPDSHYFDQKLKEFEFSTYYKSNDFTIYSSYVKDRKNFFLKYPMLFIFVIIHEQKIGYQSKLIINEINRLEDDLYKNKKRIVNYTVYIAKSGILLTNKIQEQCDYITFNKVGARSVVNINIYYETKSKSSYFLYSDTYSPSSFYKYAVDFLKSLLNS